MVKPGIISVEVKELPQVIDFCSHGLVVDVHFVLTFIATS